jgi:hypothetical protein
MDIYYGGLNTPDGIGHNHIAVVGDNIIHMRENNRILIDNK